MNKQIISLECGVEAEVSEHPNGTKSLSLLWDGKYILGLDLYYLDPATREEPCVNLVIDSLSDAETGDPIAHLKIYRNRIKFQSEQPMNSPQVEVEYWP